MEKLIELNTENISKEHICCAISDKKCSENSHLQTEVPYFQNYENLELEHFESGSPSFRKYTTLWTTTN